MSALFEADRRVDLEAVSSVPRLQIDNLEVMFRRDGGTVHSVRDVSLTIGDAEIVALLGESGSGKSVLGLSVLGLLPTDPAPTVRGRVAVCGTDMLTASPAQRRSVRRQHLGAVFQDPMTSLNPVMRVGDQIAEVAGSTAEAQRLLELVAVPEARRRMRAYPHELSGGQRQRVMIAMAIAGQPDLIVADEPTTALDVTVQAQILTLLSDLRDEVGCSVLIVTHDVGVAAQIADRVAVMYGGRLMESGVVGDVLAAPSHPYTAGLLASRVSLEHPAGYRLPTLTGAPVDPRKPPCGCPFSARCHASVGACDQEAVEPTAAPTHAGVAACLHPPGALDPSVRQPEALPAPMVRATAREVPMVRCRGVEKDFSVRTGPFARSRFTAVRNLILDVEEGESVAIVGESGSGKSTLLRIVAGLETADRGAIDIAGPPPQMIFQDAGASLTPWLKVGQLIGARLPRSLSRRVRRDQVAQALELVGLQPSIAEVKASQLSGGQRQRVAFARATIVPPSLLLCDEPTSALDASLAAATLNLLQTLRAELGLTVMFVTHDLAAAKFVADRIAVMYQGEIVEIGPASEVIEAPSHPYTKALLAAIPEPGHAPVRLLGEPTKASGTTQGCPYHPRCPERVDICAHEKPLLLHVGKPRKALAACVHARPDDETED